MLIFDLDGTLIDSANDIGTALNLTLEQLDQPTFSKERIVAHVGTGILPLIKERFGEDGERFENASQLFEKNYDGLLCKETQLYDGMREVLEHFSETPKVVLTNKRQKFAEKIIRLLGIEKFFLGVYGGDYFEEKKPSPLPINKILEIHKQNKGDTWMIGDTFADIRAAKSAGVKSCGILFGYSKPDKLLAENADKNVKETRELMEVLCP